MLLTYRNLWMTLDTRLIHSSLSDVPVLALQRLIGYINLDQPGEGVSILYETMDYNYDLDLCTDVVV